jgi:translation initiation factor 6
VERAAQEVLGAPCVRLLINQSNLLGTYCALNSRGALVPEFAQASEVEALKAEGLQVHQLDSRWGAAGNNILCNDRAALLNPHLPRPEAENIRDVLDVEVLQEPVGGIPTVGSINLVTNKGLLAYNRITEVELRRLEGLFKVPGVAGSANLGVPFLGICAVANSHGALLGELSSGIEVQRAYEALSGTEG